jgi:hypothetical protein
MATIEAKAHNISASVEVSVRQAHASDRVVAGVQPVEAHAGLPLSNGRGSLSKHWTEALRRASEGSQLAVKSECEAAARRAGRRDRYFEARQLGH